MLVAELTMAQFEDALRATRTAIIPLGSVEEHGLHLPLSTDTLQVVEVARRAAELVPVFVAPPLHYGYCRSTRDHPGTISIRPETLRRLLVDIGASFHRHGVRGLILASGHAGGLHLAAMEEAAERLVEDFEDLEVAAFCEYHWAQEEGRGFIRTEDDGHAGEIETSRILALESRLVRGSSPEEYPAFRKPFIARAKRAEWPGGVWGDPSKASREKGELLYERSALRMAALVREMEARLAVWRAGPP